MTDNVSAHDILVETAGQIILAQYGIPWLPDMHIHCLVHVVSLIVQAFLTSIDEADNLDENNYYELRKGEPIHYDNADEEQTALEAESVDCGLNILATEDFVLKKEEHAICDQSALKEVCYLYAFYFIDTKNNFL